MTPHSPTGTVIVAEHENQIRETKALRLALDDIGQRIKALNPGRPTSIAKTKVDEAIMWLGQNLKDLGTSHPYPHSKDPTNLTIEPTAQGLKF